MPRASRRAPGSAARLLVLALVAIALLPGSLRPAHARRNEQIPRAVRLDVHWGDKKNREVYRREMQRAIVSSLAEKDCFERILEGDDVKGDLVLEVQINDFLTEQEYDSPDSLFPGQGEHHTLLSARVSVNLDFWLHPEGKDDVEILGGHVFREVVRQPVGPADSAEDRALNDLTADAGRWVARDICDRRSRLRDKVAEALAP